MSDHRANNAIVQLVDFYSSALRVAHEREQQLTELLKARAASPREVHDLVRAVRTLLKEAREQLETSPVLEVELSRLQHFLNEYDARLGGVEPTGNPPREG